MIMLSRTFDTKEINSVIKHPYIWPRISDKTENIDEYSPPMEGIHYLYTDGVLFILHKLGDKHQIHANVIPESRDKAMAAAKEALRYAFVDLDAIEVVATIPTEYGSVYGFALKFLNDVGFVNGEHLLSLRVEEWVS